MLTCFAGLLGFNSFAWSQFQAGSSDYLYLPAFQVLSAAQVQMEINLNPEQLSKLKEIGKGFKQNTWTQQPQVDWTKLNEEQRKAKTDEMRKSYDKWAVDNKKRTEVARKEIEALLSPEQKIKLEDVELRQYSAPMLLYSNANFTEKLTLTDKQKEQLGQHKEKLQKRMAELQKEMEEHQDQANKAAISVLTTQQIEELKKLKKDGFRGLIAPGQQKK